MAAKDLNDFKVPKVPNSLNNRAPIIKQNNPAITTLLLKFALSKTFFSLL